MRYTFEIKTLSVSLGTVVADSLEEAKNLIEDEEWDDINIMDEYDREYGELINIKEE